MTTAEILKQLRKEKGLRQADVAELLGVSQPAYQKYELGNAEPNGANYVKLADFYGVTTDYLLGREPAPDPFGDYDLTDATEDEVIEAFLALPPKIRACILDIMAQLGGVVENSRTVQNADADEYEEITLGEIEDARNAEKEAYEKDAS